MNRFAAVFTYLSHLFKLKAMPASYRAVQASDFRPRGPFFLKSDPDRVIYFVAQSRSGNFVFEYMQCNSLGVPRTFFVQAWPFQLLKRVDLSETFRPKG